jgi:hypothetical protein
MTTSGREQGIQFTPRRRVGRRGRALVWLLGPLLWISLLVVVGVVVRRLNAVEAALAITAISLIIGFAVQLPLALRRRRTAVQ